MNENEMKYICIKKNYQRIENWLSAHEHDSKEIPRNRQTKETQPEFDINTHTHTYTLRTKVRDTERDRAKKTRSTFVCLVWFDLLNEWNGNDTIDSITIKVNMFFVSFLSCRCVVIIHFVVYVYSCLIINIDWYRCVNYRHEQEHSKKNQVSIFGQS